jgi:hypothetical protein
MRALSLTGALILALPLAAPLTGALDRPPDGPRPARP